MQNVAQLTGYKHLSAGLPSQDYGISFQVENYQFSIVSDGCSTGGCTDLGARYLALCLRDEFFKDKELIKDPLMLDKKIVEIIRNNAWNLNKKDMFATVQILCFDGLLYRIVSFGDGCFGFKAKDDNFVLKEISYTDNAPYYSLYNESPQIGLAWNDKASKKRVINEFKLKNNDYSPSIEISTEFVIQDPQSSQFLNTYYAGVFEKDAVDFCFIATDGLTSILENKLKNIYEVLSIKGFAGDFLKRRLGAQTRQWLKNLQEYPQDDLTIAIVKGE